MMNKKNMVKNYLYNIILKNCNSLNYLLPSENTLSRIHKVSRITCKNAISELQADGLIYRHKGKGTYISSQAVKILAPKKERKNNLIGVLLPDLKSMFILNLIAGINQELSLHNYKMLLFCTDYNQKTEEKAISELLNIGVNGFIVYLADNQQYNQELMKLLLNHVPFVTVDRYLDNLKSSVINSDNFNAVYNATMHLIHLGHSSIGLISTDPKGTSTLKERVFGYTKALSDSNIKYKCKAVLSSLVNYDATTEASIYDYLLKNKHLSAIIILNSNLALKTLRVFNMLSLRTPQDISIIAYEDDYTDFADIMQVQISSIQQDTIKIGKTASKVLIDQMNGTDPSIKQITIASKLIIRKTTSAINPDSTYRKKIEAARRARKQQAESQKQ